MSSWIASAPQVGKALIKRHSNSTQVVLKIHRLDRPKMGCMETCGSVRSSKLDLLTGQWGLMDYNVIKLNQNSMLYGRGTAVLYKIRR